MKSCVLYLLILIGISSSAQQWRLLPKSFISSSFRHDDIYFINEDTGWVCNVDGKIYKTTDAGANWKVMVNMPNTSFRCLGFINANKGWAGNLGVGRWSPTIDTMPLYQTTDGGASWQVVTTISGPMPQGICGISVVNDSVVYAVGRVGGPTYVLKTMNAGASWKSIDMNNLAYQIIDCKFFSNDTGFVIGGFPSPYTATSYRVFYTTNGGNAWQTVAFGTDTGFSAWKIFFVNRQLGYISIENSQKGDSVYFLKTTDGGLHWAKGGYNQTNAIGGQGIGFVNDSTGWCAFMSGDTKQTTDGGKTWTDAPNMLNSLNRIRMVGPNVAYGVGQRIWKYSQFGVGLKEEIEKSNKGYLLHSSPNPFVDHFTVTYRIPEAGKVTIRIYDFSGRPVKTIVDEQKSEGEYKTEVQLPYYFSTHFYLLNCNGVVLTDKVICY